MASVIGDKGDTLIAATPRSYVGYVDSEYLRVVGNLLQSLKDATYAKMQIEKGHIVLDVGCGPSTDTIPLALLVGASGEVVGVDYDEAMIAEAEKRAQDANFKERGLADVSFVEWFFGDAAQSP